MQTLEPHTTRVAPHPVLDGFYARPEERQSVVTGLFDDTARYYDRVTAMMSLGTGGAYRRAVLQRIGVCEGSRVLDVACGTGQVAGAARSLVGPRGTVIGVDPSEGMRLVAQARRGVRTMAGTAERLPVEDASFDAVVMGYALRHVSDLIGAFIEFRRVLRPGGVVAVLEITPPEGRLACAALRLYLKHIVPPLSFLVTGSPRVRELMSYYWESIVRCVSPDAILDAMARAGLHAPERRRTAGIFNEYIATAPGR